GNENDVDETDDELLRIQARFLQFLEQFSGTLIFENRVRQRESVRNTVRIQPGADALGHDVFVIRLEIFRHARNECRTDGCGEQQSNAAQKVTVRNHQNLRNVVINDQAKDLRIKQ